VSGPTGEPFEAIVVGSVDVGDSNRVLRLLTPGRGRTAVMAYSVRKGRKGWSGLLETGALLRLKVKRGKGPLPLLDDAAPVAVPKRARTDLLRLCQLAYGVELCSGLAPEEHEAHKLYRLLRAWLDLLEDAEAPGAASRQALEAKALTFAGLTPALVACAVCGDVLDEPVVWSHDAGGGCHGRCTQGPFVALDALLRTEALRRTPLAHTAGVRPAALGFLLCDFAEWQLGKGLNSRAMLEEVEET
jgi:DNA repair protein RecO (recombination protein O)